jgi:hypothetical protein
MCQLIISVTLPSYFIVWPGTPFCGRYEDTAKCTAKNTGERKVPRSDIWVES